ncbi:MAG: hypothetical protein V4506_02525 [Bacteroidota bacterium]
METKKIYTLHEENAEWTSYLLFYRDEVKIMKKRLEEIAAKNTSKEILAQVEHFQNQFILQTDTMDHLKHEINLNNDAINHEIKKNDVALERRKMEDHAALREKIAYFRKIFSFLKTEFNVFLSKWM